MATGTQRFGVAQDLPDQEFRLFVPYRAFNVPAGRNGIRAQAYLFLGGEFVQGSNVLDFEIVR